MNLNTSHSHVITHKTADVSFRSVASGGGGHLNSSTLSKRGCIYDPYDISVHTHSQAKGGDGEAALNTSIEKEEPIKGLTVLGGALSFISTIIGAGIVSLPYSLSQAGYVLGIFLHLLMMSSLMLAVVLCLKAKDNLGYQ